MTVKARRKKPPRVLGSPEIDKACEYIINKNQKKGWIWLLSLSYDDQYEIAEWLCMDSQPDGGRSVPHNVRIWHCDWMARVVGICRARTRADTPEGAALKDLYDEAYVKFIFWASSHKKQSPPGAQTGARQREEKDEERSS